jgi:multimeric flavodoxin WrbA
MKVIAINGSARSNGNTHLALKILSNHLKNDGIETEIVDLAGLKLNPCLACGKCKGQMKCIQNDDINNIFPKLLAADAIVLGSPTYFSNVASRMAMFIERTGYVARSNNQAFKGKIGAAIAVARRQGANVVYSAMHYYFGLAEMPIATSSYWNILIGREIGEIEKDTEGMETLKNLASNLAQMLKKLR